MNITIDKCCFGVLVAAVIVCSCGKGHDKPDYEQQGQRWLALARSSLRDADYSLARVYVDSLRTRCKMALNAREDAIVLLDSINLAEAREQLAEAEFLARQAGLEGRLFAASAAATREEIGNDIYPPMKRALERRGYDCPRHAARQTARADYEKYDHIVGMDDENLREIHRIAGGDPDRKIHLLLDFTDHPREIADPWYTGDFVSTYRDVMDGCESLLHEQQACQHPRLGKQGLID